MRVLHISANTLFAAFKLMVESSTILSNAPVSAAGATASAIDFPLSLATRRTSVITQFATISRFLSPAASAFSK